MFGIKRKKWNRAGGRQDADNAPAHLRDASIADHYDMSAERRIRKGRGTVPVAGRTQTTLMQAPQIKNDRYAERRIRTSSGFFAHPHRLASRPTAPRPSLRAREALRTQTRRLTNAYATHQFKHLEHLKTLP